MRLTLCKLCQFADRLAAGNPVLVGLFSRMGVPQYPAFLDPCFLVLEIEADPGETGRTYPFEVRLIDEDGRTVSEWQNVLELPHHYEPSMVRTFAALRLPWDDRFVFQSDGMYRFDVVLYPGEPTEEVLGGETLLVHLGPPRV